METIHSSRIIRNYVTVLTFIFTLFLFFLQSDLSAKEKGSGFIFNPQSEYWPTKAWKTSTPERQGMSSDLLGKVFEEIENRNIDISSILVVRNGYIVVEANKLPIQYLYSIYSSTKSFTSAIFGIALAKGHIKNISQPIAKFFPVLSYNSSDPRKASITLKHLLTMSCGFEWPELRTDYMNPENPVYQMMMSKNWVTYLLSKPISKQPGLIFNYNSGCSHLLFATLYRTGIDVADFAQKNLFSHLGISPDQYLWGKDSKDMLNGSHGLSMSSRNMAKFGYLYLKGGHWEGKQIISKTWIKESTKKQIEMTWEGRTADHYGYKWFIHSFGFHSLGYGGQYIFVIPSFELVVVFTSNLVRHKSYKIPVNLVKSRIIPAAKDMAPLPENSNAVISLKSKVKRFERD